MNPCAESCEKNQVPILAVLKEIFSDRKRVLEIASGTGQHAVNFDRELTHLVWQPSELAQNLAGLLSWLDEAQLPYVLLPLAIDANDARWPVAPVDAIFNAKTVHIISWLKLRDPNSGVRDFVAVNRLAASYGLDLLRDIAMPSNNRILVWQAKEKSFAD